MTHPRILSLPRRLAALLLCLLLVWGTALPARADTGDLDRIDSYTIEVTPQEDGTLHMKADILWTVLDSESEGPLEWVEIGLPNGAATDPAALMYLALADSRGKISPGNDVVHEEFLTGRLALYRECMARPQVMGRDLLEAGLTPGSDFSHFLAYARKLHLAGVEKDSALKQTLSYAKKARKRRMAL